MTVQSFKLTFTPTYTRPADNPLIALENIDLVYNLDTDAPFTALEAVDLGLAEGDFVCAIGPSGCGKTSLLRVLAGYEKPTYGTVSVDGRPHTKPDAEVGVVFQQPNLFPWLTIEKNVDFGPRMKGVDAHERRQRVSYFLEMVALIEAAKKLPHQLSGGMKQRVSIARSIAVQPDVLLLDEPFSALDIQLRRRLQTFLFSIWQKTATTMVLVTHNVEEAILLGQQLIVIGDRPGRIIETVNIADDRFRDRYNPDFLKLQRHLEGVIEKDANIQETFRKAE